MVQAHILQFSIGLDKLKGLQSKTCPSLSTILRLCLSLLVFSNDITPNLGPKIEIEIYK